MMRFTALFLLFFFFNHPSYGFVNPTHEAATGLSPLPMSSVQDSAKNQLHHDKVTHHRKIDEIAHELEELGAEIKPQVLRSEPHGFHEYHESLVHKLRRRIHEHDVKFQQELKQMKAEMKELEERVKKVDELESRLERTENALFWTEVDLEIEREKRLRYVLWHAFRLTKTKVDNAVGKATDSMLKFLHLYHEYKEDEFRE